KEPRPLKADARVVVKNVEGLIEVEGWDKRELELTGELGPDVEKLEITGNESSIRIEVKLPRSKHDIDGDTRLKLKIPYGATLEAQGVSADVRVRGLKGPVTAESVSGDVRLEVESAKIKGSSVSGDVVVDAPAKEARLNSVSGDVRARGIRGELRVESVSGDITIEGRELASLEAETVSGDVNLDVEPTREANISVETLSGEVTVTLPSEPQGEIRVETFSGEISSPWWKIDEDEKEFRRDGTGKGRLSLHSFSGDIVVRRR
ncbi:MAG: DUF4097 family beta strand repeat-containing protein, partial [Nevskiaceae bacterium]